MAEYSGEEFNRRGKRKVLVVEDVELNREILKSILSEDYDVLTAVNGAEGLDLLRAHYRELSIVLLDVYMPVCDGFEFLRQYQQDTLISNVPVMVTTGSEDAEDELRCLELGASDFITKPYNSRVVLSRVRSIIRLHESDATLAAVEYDNTTGLYTRPAFNHHAEEWLRESDSPFAMVVVEIENLSQLENSLGEYYCTELIAYFARKYQNIVRDTIGFTRDDQMFLLMVQDCTDPEAFLSVARRIEADSPYSGNVILKYGFYYDIDKELPIRDICERAVLVVRSISGQFITNYAVYNDKIAKKEQERYQIESGFDSAIKAEEFDVWLQPKYGLIENRIIGAEALVRWRKPDGTVVSPGAFIPVYEQDGLITRLDEYVFRKICVIQRERLAKGLPIVRISINLSRMTLINENVAERYADIVREYGLTFDCISIELTESFALENDQVEKLCADLVNAGFRLDMDDFGSGYSSMSGLVTLPFSVIKIDKSLIDRIGEPKGEIIVEYTINLSHKLGMIVVAEGVEHEWQAEFLAGASCDTIQGYYFSKPVPKDEFFAMLDKKVSNT